MWDRWDDAMDDSSDDQRRLEDEIEELKEQLEERGIDIPEIGESEKSDFGESDHHPHRIYMNEVYKEQNLKQYRDLLLKLL